MAPHPEKLGNGTGYVFMTLAHPKRKLEGGYEQYRRVRVNMLEAYCMGVLKKFLHLKRVIGIATEPPPTGDNSMDFSEDMIMIEQLNWTPEQEAEVDKMCRQFEILKEDRVNVSNFGLEEYPRG
ncbi:MAG: hypothetical protein HZA19_03420 [Nitrospirae bacterium]|nr:hypothetical protein [Nitrospirota bacterium]